MAIGGNALIPAGERGLVTEEFAHARVVAHDLAQLVARGFSLVVTHGNGPQVGIILRRSDLTAALDTGLPRLPLFYCVAETQGGIGYLLANALGSELRRLGLPDRVATVMTQTLVSADDPAFATPTKPVGPFYSADEAIRFGALLGWDVVEDAGRGYRRVVPSPRPLRVLESGAVSSLVREGFAVIAGGGGGVPVVERAPGEYAGIDAVIDKDGVSALLASELSADLLVLCTSVPQVALDFGKPTQRFLSRISLEEAGQHLAEGQFPPGSMGPKVEAAIAFLRAGGREVLIAALEHVVDALEGKTGTRITRAAAAAARD